MSQATARAIYETDLEIVPLERARATWEAFAASHSGTTLYHSRPWLEVLRRAMGVNPSVALIGAYNSTLAACLLAPGGNPMRRSLISLPFSDFCPPLAVDDGALSSLMSGLTDLAGGSRIEIRGADAPAPWHVLDHFQRWSLDLTRPFKEVERAADREIRRHMRRAGEAGVTVDCSDSIDALEGFFALHAENRRRLGVPSQPHKFFSLVHEVFARDRTIETWCAWHHGHRVAAVVVLRHGDTLHAKWSARTPRSPDGASHLIFMAIAEHYAQRARELDFGRTDSRNHGLTRFKRQLGATPSDLPYAYFPQMPNVTSAENLTGMWRTASRVWRTLPVPVTRVLNNVTYRYLA